MLVCCACVCEWTSLAKWSGRQPSNRKVVCSITGVASLVLLFPWAKNLYSHCFSLWMGTWCWLGSNPPSCNTMGTCTGNNWGIKCQTAIHVYYWGLSPLEWICQHCMALSAWVVPRHPSASLGWRDCLAAASDLAFCFAFWACVWCVCEPA